ncbi:MAG: sugar ABC transporter permease [Clostridiales bacterium]|nr:sugar ABC transporter permease [Clostridiales bacterium]
MDVKASVSPLSRQLRRFFHLERKQEVSLYRKREKSTAITAAIFITPALLLMIIYIVYPIVDTFRISLYEWNGIAKDKLFIGSGNWRTLLNDARFWASFSHNVEVMILSILIQIPTAFLLATFLDAGGKKFNLFKIVWFLPLLMSSVAVGFLFQYALATNGGVISTISNFFGGKNIDLLGHPDRALYTVIGVIAWQYIPFYMVYFLAGYSGFDFDIYEAAIIDGATRPKYVCHIAIPMLMPTIRAACILSLIGSLKYFDLVYVMTGGGPVHASDLMATYMYSTSFMSFKMGYGSAIAAGMFILITTIAVVMRKILTGKGDD